MKIRRSEGHLKVIPQDWSRNKRAGQESEVQKKAGDLFLYEAGDGSVGEQMTLQSRSQLRPFLRLLHCILLLHPSPAVTGRKS